MREYMDAYRARRKAFALELLGGKCVQCGSTENLHFDHIDPKSRALGIADMYAMSESRLVNELLKCQLLCREHHIDKTLADHNTQRAKGTHGTISSLRYCKPRCDLCKKVARENMRKYRLTHSRKRIPGNPKGSGTDC